MKKTVFAPGKIIISGEHSVVHGYPALVTVLDKGVRVTVTDQLNQIKTKDQNHDLISDFLDTQARFFAQRQHLKLDGLKFYFERQIPIKAGLGSSTAFISALFKALSDWFELDFSQDQLFREVMAAEKQQYPTVSGVDQTAIVYKSSFIFQKSDQGYKLEALDEIPSKLKNFNILDSGQADETTAEMVALFKKNVIDVGRTEILEKMGQVTNQIIKNAQNDLFDKELISANHQLLVDAGMVGQKAQDMIKQIESKGGVAKISGAGGAKSGSGTIIAWTA